MKPAVTFIIVLLLTSCSDPQPYSNLPMKTPFSGTGPWQITTYSNSRVEREVIKVENGQAYIIPKAVYLNIHGQFVFKDNTPILTSQGEIIYWNEDGMLLTPSGERWTKGALFSIEGRPVANTEAFLFKSTLVLGKASLDKEKASI